MAIITHDEQDFAKKMMKVLGLPRYTKSFELRVAVNEVVSCKCEFFCNINVGDIETIFVEYDLIKKVKAQ